MAFEEYFSVIVTFISLFSFSLSIPTTPDAICNSTVNPSFCRSKLPRNTSWDVYDYSHFSFRQSLSTTKNVSSFVSNYLKEKPNLPVSAVRVLEDCKELAELNDDFLSRTIKVLGSKRSPLTRLQAEEMQALFCAILTNQQTCSDGLQSTSSASNATSDLQTSLSDASKMYSLALALFSNTWGNDIRRGSSKREEMIQAAAASKVDKIKHLPRFLKRVSVNTTVVVNPNGSGNFTSINDAIGASPNDTDISNGYFVIYVVAGVYEEYINITKSKQNLLMIGDGINKTVITGNRSAGGGWSTFNSATFIVVGQGFVGVAMTIRNTAGAIKNQAVALRSGADMSAFYNCSFEGYQDTLYTHSLRQFYRDCEIYGTVDFIFGNAAVVLQNCSIYPTLPIHGQRNDITAQGRTDPNQSTGISIQKCSIQASAELASSNDTTQTYLGRPWKEYSRTVYMQSFMDDLINPSGWDVWSGDFALSTLYYAEYNNTGPGSDTANRVTWPGYHVIDAAQAINFTVSNFIAGEAWLPKTGVPYTGGLV